MVIITLYMIAIHDLGVSDPAAQTLERELWLKSNLCDFSEICKLNGSV